MKNKELKQNVIDKFWQIYENNGTVQALSWLETLKYYDDYCNDDISYITDQISKMSTT